MRVVELAFDLEDVPMEVAGIFIVMAALLQVMFWLPTGFSTLIPPSTLKTFSPLILLASLAFLGVAGWRFLLAVRERFSTGDYHGYVYAQLDKLENRLVNVEKSLAKFQRRVLGDVEALKAEVSNVAYRSKVDVLGKPSREDLEKLRAKLELEGSLQCKGRTIYHVQYDSEAKKHHWNRLGTWSDLKQKLQDEKPLE